MRTYFFDLDGTLVDSSPGLLMSFRAGLAAFAVPALSDAALSPFLGTPLPLLFREVRPDVSARDIDKGIQAFRADYEHQGMRNSRLYPGVVDMLAAIRRHRRRAWIVTSKPQRHAVAMARLFGLDEWVDGIIGAGLSETDTKTDLVARALAESGASNPSVFFVGDRHYDVTGALENHVTPIGALWGYGSRDELRAAGCSLFAVSPEDFQLRFVDQPNDHSGFVPEWACY